MIHILEYIEGHLRPEYVAYCSASDGGPMVHEPQKATCVDCKKRYQEELEHLHQQELNEGWA